MVSTSSSRKSGPQRIILRRLLTFVDEGHISFQNVSNPSRHDAASQPWSPETSKNICWSLRKIVFKYLKETNSIYTYISIKAASPTCFDTSEPSSGSTALQAENQLHVISCYLKVLLSVAARLLKSIMYKRYLYRFLKNISLEYDWNVPYTIKYDINK